MLIEKFFNLLFSCISNLFDFLPDLEFTIPDGLTNATISFCKCASYFLPMPALTTLFSLELTVIAIRIGWSFYMRVIKILRG